MAPSILSDLRSSSLNYANMGPLRIFVSIALANKSLFSLYFKFVFSKTVRTSPTDLYRFSAI